MNNQYDNLIKKSSEKHLPGVDWRLIKAQLFQESSLQADAMSPAGAQGLAQFMPETWNEASFNMGLPVTANPFEPEYAIPACCWYMEHLYRKWTAPRPDADRYALTLASYNAGFGNLLKSQELAGGVNDYRRIAAQLHHVTGIDNAAQTRKYVRKIFEHFISQLLWAT